MDSQAVAVVTEDYSDIDTHAPLDPLQDLPSIPALRHQYSPYQQRIRLIHAVSQGHTVTWAARYAGVCYKTIYDWIKSIPTFGAAWKEATEQAAGDVWEERLMSISQQDSHLGAAGVATIVGLKMRKRFVEGPSQPQQAPPVQIINVVCPPGVTPAQVIEVAQQAQLASPSQP